MSYIWTNPKQRKKVKGNGGLLEANLVVANNWQDIRASK